MTTLLLLAAVAAAPTDRYPLGPLPGDAAMQSYLDDRVRLLESRFADGAKSQADWEAKRPTLKSQYFEMLGLWPLPDKTPLQATLTGRLDRGHYVIELLHFQSRPGLYVTGNLYRPKNVPEGTKLPAILYVCGHSNQGRNGNKTGYQEHGIWYATHGYVCLMLDTLQLGELAGIHHGTYRLERWWWQDRGYTPAGVECWNGIRALDYLCSRPDVDPHRIGMTGQSGGGATTVWVAAADERVQAAVPVSGFSDLSTHVSERVINGHCDCMFPINTYRWDLTTILALIAPRPLLFANTDADIIFPMSGNRRVAAKLRGFYEMLGAAAHFDDFTTPGPHKDLPALREAAFRFFNRHLKGETGPVGEVVFPKLDPKELRVFPTDEDLPKDAINARVDETFVPKAEVTLPKAEEFARWKAGLVKQLQDKCFRTVSKEEPGPRHPPQTLIVLNPSETPEDEVQAWTTRLALREPVRPVRLLGSSPTAWTRKNPPNTVERSFPLIGETVDSARLAEVVDLLRATPGVRLVGRGQAGVIAAYAALLQPQAVREVVLLDPPASHQDGPHFLNVLRVLDIPVALGLLAPDVTLTLIGASDPAFDTTAALYTLAGAKDKLTRVSSPTN